MAIATATATTTTKWLRMRTQTISSNSTLLLKYQFCCHGYKAYWEYRVNVIVWVSVGVLYAVLVRNRKQSEKLHFYAYFHYIGNGFRHNFQRWYIYVKNAWMLVNLEACHRWDNLALCIQDVDFHFLTDMTWFTETVACHQQTQFHSMWNQPMSTIVLYQLIMEPSHSAGRPFTL